MIKVEDPKDMRILSDEYAELRIETEDGKVIARITHDDAEPDEGYVIVLRPTPKNRKLVTVIPDESGIPRGLPVTCGGR